MINIYYMQRNVTVTSKSPPTPPLPCQSFDTFFFFFFFFSLGAKAEIYFASANAKFGGFSFRVWFLWVRYITYTRPRGHGINGVYNPVTVGVS